MVALVASGAVASPPFCSPLGSETVVNRSIGRRVSSALVATLVAALALVAAPTKASAYDAYPCHSPRVRTFTWAGYTYPNVEVRTCPLWTGHVPVYEWSSTAAPIVGELVYGGNANWFVVEKWSNYAPLGGFFNHYWASTMADNGRWGWVPETYFSGGGNDEDDGGLLLKGTFTCGGSCKPIPPWWQ
jgi:hypothetical protein